MKKTLLIALFPLTTLASTLDTPNYRIEIESNCVEGEVSCDRMTYHGTSKISGNAISLEGRTWHTTCADGVTPCRFLGYRFENGAVTYRVHEDGLLEVVRHGDEVLVHEQGTWQR
ncbi:hypothetical protein [Marinobacter sp. JSM 1782161]|uniref:hypothetical protein n=1 Tax=Marinobacter sp. JSM 1782161 TaxID=2685906 RepID=UPI001401C694|nr:hypothetical protein [Marinobacter sp. JSM 1782161]